MKVIKFVVILMALAVGSTCFAAEVDTVENLTGITKGRARSLVAGLAGLTSLVIGGLALARSKGRIGAIATLMLGLIAMLLSVVHLGSSTGGFGTGSGRAGAIIALVLGLIGVNLGGLALARSRRTGSSVPSPSRHE